MTGKQQYISNISNKPNLGRRVCCENKSDDFIYVCFIRRRTILKAPESTQELCIYLSCFGCMHVNWNFLAIYQAQQANTIAQLSC